MAPYVVVKAFTGPLVDRTGRGSFPGPPISPARPPPLAVPCFTPWTCCPFPLLLVLVALIGAARGPGDLAKEVMVPEAAERAGSHSCGRPDCPA